MNRLLPWVVLGGLTLALLLANPLRLAVNAEPSAEKDDEQTLHSAGLSADGTALLAFFHARARGDIDKDQLRALLQQFAAASNQERSLATAQFLGLGPLAIPTLRGAANDLQNPEVAQRAAKCLQWLEGSSRSTLPAAAARILVQRTPHDAAAALLDYLPFADNPEVIQAVTTALAAIAAPKGKPDPALLRGLTDPLAVRRAAAGIALCRATSPDQVPAVRKLLQDPAPGVRLRVALALGEARDAEAMPVLIDLLGELPAESRHRIETFLTQLAGEWAPASHFQGEDEIARKIRRDAWAAWWRDVDGASLLTAIRRRTLTAQDRETIRGLLDKLGAEDFASREAASRQLFALGRRSLPQLQESAKDKDAEVARRAKFLIERIEHEPAHHLPVAAVRLLSVRKPAGSVAALLSYLPFAEDDNLTAEVGKSLTVLALREGKPNPDLLHALDDPQPLVRATAAEALIHGGGTEGRSAVHKLLKDPSAPIVRLRVALALARAKERDAVPVLIDLLTVLPTEQMSQVEETLHQLAANSAPEVSAGEKPEEKKKCRDAWVAWWKNNAARVDLARLTTRIWYGYTLICDLNGNRVYEIDRSGKQRWAVTGCGGPVDACVLPGNRVLIAEYGADRVTERDFKGAILFQKRIPNPVNVQRLANGNTFIATFNGPIVEWDRTGKEVYTINNVPGGVQAAYRSRKGHIVCLTRTGQCVYLDTSGKQLKSFATNHNGNNIGGMDLLPNDRILVMQANRNKVAEFDSTGKLLLEVDAPAQAGSASGLPNGHILIASQNAQQVYEVDRTGKVVWEHKGAGQAFRARRR
ncbi:MAG TPA: HEAT repeat domain-containing protein [Gemmataceae bacterium]|nr:HEAT repeat domain-containing protein [Gemmataceae bacterium]